MDQEALLDGAWCLVELMVAPSQQGAGLGRALLLRLTAGLSHPRVVCSTQDGANPARSFYARFGFREACRVRFGDGPDDAYLLLAADLPLGR